MNTYRQELDRVHRRWRRGLAASVLLDLAVGLVAGLVVLGAADLFLALDSLWRLCLAGGLALALLAVAAVRLVRIAVIRPRESAVYADSLLQSRRQEILAAFELEKPVAADTGTLAGFFIDACIRQAAERLKTMPDPFPAGAWRTSKRRAWGALALLILPGLLSPRMLMLEGGRILTPYADLPPYSRYIFTVSPEAPQAIYGSDQVVGVVITGAPVSEPVQFITRQGGRTHETPCFQGSPTQFAQRLERVMQPVEFCFRTGRARSRWHTLTVLLEPHIESASVRLAPPAYSRLPERLFSLGSESLAGLRGTRAEMTVRSNRPLRDGTLTLTPLDGSAHARAVEGVKKGADEMVFSWVLERPSRLALNVRDINGTPGREPLRAAQEIVPDEPPRVTLTTPALFSLATPRVVVPVEGDVQDDIGLQRADLFRGVMGYRPRGETVDLHPGSVAGEVTGRLDLARLGVEPGQVLEVVAEAADNNPDLTGIGASDVSRIQIISEEEYAEILRSRTTLDQFQERFKTAAERVEKLRRDLQETRDALRDGKLDPEAASKRMKELETLASETAAGMRELAAAFSAFDLEKKLATAAGETAGALEKALANPGWKAAAAAGQAEALEAALAALGGEKKIAEAAQQAEEAAEVARVMAIATWYKALLDRQELLVWRQERYAAGERQTIDAAVLAKTQDAIREELEKLMTELDKRAAALPDEYVQFRTSAFDFLYTLRGLEVPVPMTESAAASRNDRAREAWTQGALALEKMREMLSKCGGSSFGGLCNGKMKFQVPGDLGSTMAQMLKSLMQQAANGTGQGLGPGVSGIGADGTGEGSMDGYSAMATPLYGPSRGNPFPAGSGATGQGDGSGSGGGPVKKAAAHEVMRSDNTRTVNGRGVTAEAVPARYREAVKAFYSGEVTP